MNMENNKIKFNELSSLFGQLTAHYDELEKLNKSKIVRAYFYPSSYNGPVNNVNRAEFAEETEKEHFNLLRNTVKLYYYTKINEVKEKLEGYGLSFDEENNIVPSEDKKEESKWPTTSFNGRDWAKVFLEWDESLDNDELVICFAECLMTGYERGFAAAKALYDGDDDYGM